MGVSSNLSQCGKQSANEIPLLPLHSSLNFTSLLLDSVIALVGFYFKTGMSMICAHLPLLSGIDLCCAIMRERFIIIIIAKVLWSSGTIVLAFIVFLTQSNYIDIIQIIQELLLMIDICSEVHSRDAKACNLLRKSDLTWSKDLILSLFPCTYKLTIPTQLNRLCWASLSSTPFCACVPVPVLFVFQALPSLKRISSRA